MRHGSLFSGIGGFDYAAELMGWDNVFHCEWEEFPRTVLQYYWPDAISYGDITETDFTIHRGKIDILTGGFPCQPYSQAGKRLGKEDDRHLWPEMLRAIREIQPTWVVGENVRGLINWSGGLVFEEVQADLEAEGYEVQPFILPACAVDAPHRRDRIWFVAYSNKCDDGGIAREHEGEIEKERLQERDEVRKFSESDKVRPTHNTDQFNGYLSGLRASEIPQQQKTRLRQNNITNTPGIGLEGREVGRKSKGKKSPIRPETLRQLPRQDWQDFPTKPAVRGRNDGISSGLDGITFSKWRNESIKGYGNAVVPALVMQIFKSIEEYNQTINH